MKHFCVLFFIFCNLISLNLFAKLPNDSNDSLKRLIINALKNTTKPPDTLTIGRIDKLAEGYFESFPDSTLYYGKLEIKLSKKINYPLGIADGNVQLASVNTFRCDYSESAKNYTAALNIYLQLHNSHGISTSYIGLGRIQDYLGNYDNAISLFNKALALILKTHNEVDEAECYNMMGVTYDNKGEFSKSLDCYFKSLIINIKHKNDLAAADKYSNIGVVMQELELYPKALDYYNRAYRLWKKLDDKQGISVATQNIGETLIAQKKYKQSIGYLNTASVLFHQLGDQDGISLVDFDFGLYYYYTNRIDSAIHYLNLSLLSAKQNKIKYNKANAYVGLALVYNLEKDYKRAYNYAVKAQHTGNNLGSLSVKADATLQVSKALAGLKQFEEAYNQHKLYVALRDSIDKNESIHKVMLYNLEIDFEKTKKELADKQNLKENIYQQKIQRQESENQVYAIIIGIMAVLVVVYYRGKRKQQKINALLAEKNVEVLSQQEDLNSQATKLNELNLLKDRLIGVLAHDLRAPISTLRGLFTLMIDASITREEFIEMTPRVFNTLEHTSDFLDTLLFWINSQVDHSEKNVKNFHINNVVSRELTHMDDKLLQKNIKVNVKIAPDAIALADPNSVRIVIHNFLTNAIKFSNRDSIIEISARVEDDERVIFCLKDHGIGMTEEYLDNLFKNRVNSTVGTENESGTGMGLLFCKDLIEKNKGTIWVKSSLGVGTQLCFSLPLGIEVVV